MRRIKVASSNSIALKNILPGGSACCLRRSFSTLPPAEAVGHFWRWSMSVRWRNRTFLATLTAAGAALIAGLAKAQTVTNPSFESPATSGFIDDSQGSINNPTNSGFWGWGYFFANTSGDHDSGVQADTNCTVTASADGSLQNGWVNGGGNYLYQDVGALAPNTTYNLTVAIAAPGGTAYGGVGSGNAQPTDTIELLNGTNVLTGSSADVAVSGTVLATSGVLTPPNGSFADQTISYTTGSSVSGDLTLLLEEDTTGAHEQGIFDDVRLSAAVPEPASLMTLLGGTAMCLIRRRRHRA
jgi:hypothetical protein